MRNKGVKNKILNALRFTISLSLLGLLFWILRGNLDGVAGALRKANFYWFGATFLLHMGIMLLLSWRMQLVFVVTQVKLSFKEAVQLNFIGYFFNNFLPTSAGGDVVKAYYSGKISHKNVESFSAVLADRLFGTYAIFLVAGVTVGFVFHSLQNSLIAWIIWAVLILFTGGLLFTPSLFRLLHVLMRRFRWKRLSLLTEQLQEIAESYGKNAVAALQVLGLSVLTKVLSVVGAFLLTQSLGVHVPFLTLLWVVPLVFAVSMLPSLNGLGIREGTYVYFLGPYIGREYAFALSLLWLAVYFLSDVIGGLIYAFSREFRALPTGSKSDLAQDAEELKD